MKLAAGVIVHERFVLREKLGAGGFATVWSAADLLRGGELVALKVLHPLGVARAWTAQRFDQEVAILATLDHPGIVRALWWQLEGDQPMLAMELVSGTTLDQELRHRSRSQRGLSDREVCAIVRSLVAPLSYSHAQGVIHRDLKPRNVMLSDDPRALIKVLDFGVAKLVGRDASDATTQGRVLGSVLYLAPEQIQGGEVDQRTDVFGLGCLVYELLTLSYAWARDAAGAPLRISDEAVRSSAENSVATLMERIARGPRPLVSPIRRGATERLDRVISSALAADPRERFSEVVAFERALAGALGVAPSEAELTQATQALRASRRRDERPVAPAPASGESAAREAAWQPAPPSAGVGPRLKLLLVGLSLAGMAIVLLVIVTLELQRSQLEHASPVPPAVRAAREAPGLVTRTATVGVVARTAAPGVVARTATVGVVARSGAGTREPSPPAVKAPEAPANHGETQDAARPRAAPRAAGSSAPRAAPPPTAEIDPLEVLDRRLDQLEARPDRDALLAVIADLERHVRVSKPPDESVLLTVLKNAEFAPHVREVRRVLETLRRGQRL
ncbi:MAG: protein kinase [Deltaproteobacteria bacterium]|nr:protein kinase [Deltaproteobacteria bacterium]